jgi:hypothetical protein
VARALGEHNLEPLQLLTRPRPHRCQRVSWRPQPSQAGKQGHDSIDLSPRFGVGQALCCGPEGIIIAVRGRIHARLQVSEGGLQVGRKIVSDYRKQVVSVRVRETLLQRARMGRQCTRRGKEDGG